jgi:hypothetical protein
MSRPPSPEGSAFVRKRLIGLALVVAIGSGGVWYLLNRDAGVITGEILTEARFPSAMVVLSDGTIRYTERLTGQVRDVGMDGELEPEPVVDLDVSVGGQRGLLGLALDDAGRTFAAWTRSDQRLVVAEIDPAERVVWVGPETSDLNIGGRLAFDPGGRLVVGIGDLQDPDSVVDTSLPNGKMLALDPDGLPDQEPEAISGGWTNPAAFGFASDGVLWVADDAPDDTRDRLTRGDLDARRYPLTELSDEFSPTGLTIVDDDLYVCGFVSRRMLRFRLTDDEAVRRGRVLATNCSTGVVALEDGSLAYSNEGTIFTLDPERPNR